MLETQRKIPSAPFTPYNVFVPIQRVQIVYDDDFLFNSIIISKWCLRLLPTFNFILALIFEWWHFCYGVHAPDMHNRKKEKKRQKKEEKRTIKFNFWRHTAHNRGSEPKCWNYFHKHSPVNLLFYVNFAKGHRCVHWIAKNLAASLLHSAWCNICTWFMASYCACALVADQASLR